MSTTSPSSLVLPTTDAEDQLGLALEGKLPNKEGVPLKRTDDLVASPSPSVIFRSNGGGGSFGSAQRSGHGSFGSSGYGSGSGSGYFGTLPVYRHRKTYNNTSEEDSPANPIDFKFKQLGNGDLAADVTVLARERIRSRSSSIDGVYSIPSPYFTSAQIPTNQNSLETFNSLRGGVGVGGETSAQNSIHQISSSSIDSESYASATDSVGDFRFVSEYEEIPWWSNEDFATMCSLCFSEFGFFVRKHHCRYCGSIVCYRCSTLKVKMRWLGYSEPVRICDRCRGPVKLIAAQERDDAPPSFPHLSQYQQQQQQQQRRQRERKHRERTLLNENDEDEEQEQEEQKEAEEEEDIYKRQQRKSKVKEPYKARVITEMNDSEGKWWLVLLSRWDSTPGTKRQIVGQKIWKGLPVPLRGKVWQVVSGARAARFQDHQLFSNVSLAYLFSSSLSLVHVLIPFFTLCSVVRSVGTKRIKC
jgi:hypothetical protein